MQFRLKDTKPRRRGRLAYIIVGKIETRIEIFEKLLNLDRNFLVRIVNLASCEASSQSFLPIINGT